MRVIPRVMVWALILVNASACAVVTRQEPIHEADRRVDYDNPIHGVRVPSVRDAQKYLGFTAVEPRGLGTPVATYVSNPQASLRAYRSLAVVYDSPQYGRFSVVEGRPEVSESEFHATNESLEAANGGPDVHGTAEVVHIRGGVEALITTSEDAARSDISWLERDVEFIIRGPNLRRGDVVDIAESI